MSTKSREKKLVRNCKIKVRFGNARDTCFIIVGGGGGGGGGGALHIVLQHYLFNHLFHQSIVYLSVVNN